MLNHRPKAVLANMNNGDGQDSPRPETKPLRGSADLSIPVEAPVPQEVVAEADAWAGLLDTPLFNPLQPAYILRHERPEHRAIIFLRSQCLTYKEIAAKLGWSPAGVANVCKQPWAQAIIVKELQKAGREAVQSLLDAEDVPSVLKLVEIRDDPTAPKAEQRKAANDLLDRKYGKPTQPILTAEVDPRTLSDVQLAEIAKRALPN